MGQLISFVFFPRSDPPGVLQPPQMTWFFNHEGTADGPHDEASMIDFIKAGRVTARTLIWHEGLPKWQEAGIIRSSWWQETKPATPPAELQALKKPKDADSGSSRRKPTPLAPTEEAPKTKSGFLKRLFGRKE
jgi:hypothetical protein